MNAFCFFRGRERHFSIATWQDENRSPHEWWTLIVFWLTMKKVIDNQFTEIPKQRRSPFDIMTDGGERGGVEPW